MKVKAILMHGRRGWLLNNNSISLFLMAGGGHIADLRLKGTDKINPLWAPPWKTMEPWKYRRSLDGRYGQKLLACIYGHNLCLSAFGDSSPEETRCGIGCHYEAPVTRWSIIHKKVTAQSMFFEYGCLMPVAQMHIARAVSMRAASNIINVRETITNLACRDVPFTMCQHVTFGPPFLQPEVTLFDLPAVRSHTFPGHFSDTPHLKPDHDFKWPDGPGWKGKVNLRVAVKGAYSDYHANLMDPKKEQAWFSAVNPRLGLMVAYVWRRADYPWVGIWEESYSRKQSPWNAKALTRGMEFGNSPFPIGLRKAVDLNNFQGQCTYAWLPARGKIVHNYSILALHVNPDCAGVADIGVGRQGLEVKLFSGSGNEVKIVKLTVA